MKARRTLRSLGARPSQPKRLLRRSRQGGWKGFGEFRKDTSKLCSERDEFVFVGNDSPLATLPSVVKELIYRFTTKVFLEVFKFHTVTLASSCSLGNFRSNE
jgi:hypothetical protein